MLIELKKSLFSSMDDVSLIWTCIEPAIKQMRGKSFKVKTEASAELNAGQKALLMFQMLYGHSRGGILEFFSHLSYLLSEKGVWSQLKKGILYFGDHDLSELLEQVESLYHSALPNGIDWNDRQNLFDNGVLNDNGEVARLDRQLSELMPRSINRAGSYIRYHTEEFMRLIDG